MLQACIGLQLFQCCLDIEKRAYDDAMPFVYGILHSIDRHRKTLHALHLDLNECLNTDEFPEVSWRNPRFVEYGSPCILREFTHLTDLQLDWHMLRYGVGEDYHWRLPDDFKFPERIRDILPPSIQNLHIHWLHELENPFIVERRLELLMGDDGDMDDFDEYWIPQGDTPRAWLLELADDIRFYCPQLKNLDVDVKHKDDQAVLAQLVERFEMADCKLRIN